MFLIVENFQVSITNIEEKGKKKKESKMERFIDFTVDF